MYLMKLKINLRLKLAAFAEKGNLNRKIVSLITVELFWILIIGGAFRCFYYSLLLDTQHEDSFSYLNYHANIFKGQVDALRTPVYPYFIQFIKLFGKQNLIQHIVVTQSIVSFLTIIVFYKIVNSIFINRKVIIAATLVYATMLPIINFDKAIITESLSISCIVIFILLIVSILKRPTTSKAFLLTIFILFMIMLRPFFIFLLPLIIVFWTALSFIYKQSRKIYFVGLGTSLLVILLIHGYASLNKTNNGFYGISTVTNTNQLNIIIRSKLYQYGNDIELSNEINKDFSQPVTADEEWNILQNIVHKYQPKRISDFIKNSAKNKPSIFVDHTFKTAAVIQTKNIFTNYATPKPGMLARLVLKIEAIFFFVTYNKVFLFLFFDFIFIVTKWVKSKKIQWFTMLLWAMIVAQIAVAIVGAQSEYQRLTVATIPCLIIAFFGYIDKIYYTIDIQKLKSAFEHA